MAPRKAAPPNVNTLSPHDAHNVQHHPYGGSASPASPAKVHFPPPRSVSPSASFTNLLSKPSRWFNRKPSSSSSSAAGEQPARPSTSSGPVRKTKISRPTDPRPILASFQSEPRVSSSASRSVMDLSLPQKKSMDLSAQLRSPGSQPASPENLRPGGAALGDLRNLQRKAWSRSADDLTSLTVGPGEGGAPDVQFQHRVHEYRNRSNSSATLHPAMSGGGGGPRLEPGSSFTLPLPGTRPLAIAPKSVDPTVPFPTLITNVPLSSSPPDDDDSDGSAPLHSAISISVSSPTAETFPAVAVIPGPGPGPGPDPNPNPSPYPLPPRAQTATTTTAHSFAPRIASKLSAPKLPNLVPSSPKRKGSGHSQHDARGEDSPRERKGSAGMGGMGMGMGRGMFPFAMGQQQAPVSAPPTQTEFHPHVHAMAKPPLLSASPSASSLKGGDPALLSPPLAPELESVDGVFSARDARRASQIIYRAGFLNRLPDLSSSSAPLSHYRQSAMWGGGGGGGGGAGGAAGGAPNLSKGWKPCKAELKGTKLYFYKPPGDRAAGIKELFPVEIVPAEEEADEEAGIGGDDGRTNRRDEGASTGSGAGMGSARRKRAYWGRRTHPELVVGEKGVEKGSFEALVHEAVFATTVQKKPPSAQDQDTTTEPNAEADEEADVEARANEFASTILLSLPVLVGRARFENELMRCCTNFISGAVNDDEKTHAEHRATWITREYVRLHGPPADGAAWDAWAKDTLPLSGSSEDAAAAVQLQEQSSRLPGMPKSASTQAIFAPSPNPAAEQGGIGFDLASPNVGTFSPRPGGSVDAGGRMASLMEALGPSVAGSTRGTTGAGSGSGKPPPSAPNSVSAATASRLAVPQQQGSQSRSSMSSISSTYQQQPPPSLAGSSRMQPPPNTGSNANARHQRPHNPFGGSESAHRAWTVLARDGLTREVLAMIDPELIAASLGSFHREALVGMPEDLTVGAVLGVDEAKSGSGKERGRVDEMGILVGEEGSGSGAASSSSSAGSLFGSDEHPHWLTRLVLLQVLGADAMYSGPGSGAGGGGSLAPSDSGDQSPTKDDRTSSVAAQAQTSRTHSRSEVLSIWARVGEICRSAGDGASWGAICAALCARPVARLGKAWKRADRQAVAAVEAWAQAACGSGEGGELGVVTPWGGDVRWRLRETMERAKFKGKAKDEQEGDGGAEGERWAVGPLVEAREMFEGLKTRFGLCPRALKGDPEMSQNVVRLLEFWRDYAEGRSAHRAMAAKFQRIDQFMSLSFAAEPRRKGLFEPHFWTTTNPQASFTLNCHPLVPLLFPEPLPTITLVDRAQLWRNRLDSGPQSLNLQDLQHLHGVDASLSSGLGLGRRGPARLSILGDADSRGTAIPIYDGELVLVVPNDLDSGPSRPASRAPSRPPSTVIEEGDHPAPTTAKQPGMNRAPSVRVRSGSNQPLNPAGERRSSSATRRSSLPSLTARPSIATLRETPTEKPIRAMVKGGTLERLVHILIHGLQGVSASVSDDNGETSLKEGKTRELVVDHKEYARVWWNVYRSFVTPMVLFELIRKRYASKTLGVDPLVALRKRSEILDILKEWLVSGGGTQDCLDDPQLYSSMEGFLGSPSEDTRPEYDTSDEDEVQAVDKALDGIEENRKTTLNVFRSHIMRPPTSTLLSTSRSLVASTKGPGFGSHPPDVDRTSAEELVGNLNTLGLAAYSNITEEDLFITADILEVQTADRTGWFITHDLSTSEDLEIQTLNSYLLEIESSPLVSELSQDSIYKLLPPSVRSCIRAFNIVRRWLISRLVAPRIGLNQRAKRMELLLQAIEVARMRSYVGDPMMPGSGQQACVRSFVEAVVTSAVISPESRIHARAWQNVSAMRGVQRETLADLMSKPVVQNVNTSAGSLLVDVSWILERVLEVISVPNTVPASPENIKSIINFDKRRHLCDLLLNTLSLPGLKTSRQNHEEPDRRDFERLNAIEREAIGIQLDHRAIKDDAQREALSGSTSGSSARKARPFHRLVALQQEKNKRDKGIYERLAKDKKHELQRLERRDENMNRAMRTKQPLSQAQKQHRNKKSYSSAFFQLMRPISSAFTDSTGAVSVVKKTPAELDFTPSSKPSLVVSIVDAKVAQFVNNERSYTFQLDTEDGGHYILQAMTRSEMNKWMEQIRQVSKTAASRRLTYMGNSPKPQVADHLHTAATGMSLRDPTAVFGVSLDYLLRREAGGSEVEPGVIPSVMERCLAEIENRGLTEVGIYRIAGAASEISALRDSFNRGENPNMSESDIHAVCDLVKQWFRYLPEPVFPPSFYFALIEAIKLENLNNRLAAIRGVVRSLPQANFALVKRVVEHLDKVTDFEDRNQMSAEALAIVFSPNLLRAPQNDFALILSNMGHANKLVKALISHYHVIFDDEYEADHDDGEEEELEIDEAIVEEDEEDEENLPISGVSSTSDHPSGSST